MKSSGMAAQLSSTKTRSRRRDSAWMVRAMSSLPVPDSPKIRTRPLVGAMSLICWRRALMETDSPVTVWRGGGGGGGGVVFLGGGCLVCCVGGGGGGGG